MLIVEISAKEIARNKEGWYDPSVNKAINNKAVNFITKPGTELSKKDIDNIHKFGLLDQKPEGAIAKSLDKLVALSTPLTRNLVSYRGLVLAKSTVAKLVQELQQKKTVIFKKSNPSAWSNSQSVAWDFAKPGGYRNKKATTDRVGIILEVLIPAGTRIGGLNLSIGTGREHILPSNTQVELYRVRKFHTGLVFTGKII